MPSDSTDNDMRNDKLKPGASPRPASPTEPTPLDVVLLMAAEANTDIAGRLLNGMRASVEQDGDAARWIRAVLVARDTGALGDAPSVYLLDIITEAAVGRQTDTDPILVALAAQLREIERADGLDDDEAYLLDDAPAEWLELNRRWDSRFAQLRGALLTDSGESRLARLCQIRPEEFDALSLEGWAALMPGFRDE